ncbi:hypothetical protein HHK36_008159 [Tetracentron sinense]|uniref:Pentatricopeptide repeat-containing protein n=1 Tax=Tetracentron sinense TaxID=13715 RepID=A0A834ZF02_TETSI|nr:hypothetical protein HHK36_008159 [Tetracentron sinense]
MRASSFSIINVYTWGSKLIFGRTETFKFFLFRNFASSCSSVWEAEVTTTEDSTSTDEDSLPNGKCISSEFMEHNRFFLRRKDICEIFYSDFSMFENMKAEEEEMKRIKLILSNRGWNLGFGNGHRIDLNQFNVMRILNDLFDESSDASLALYFFRWSESCMESKHEIQSVCTMIHILVCGNLNHRAVDLLLHLVRNKGGGEEWHNLLLEVLEETRKDRRILELVYSMLVNCYVEENMLSMALKSVHRMKLLNIFPTIGVCNTLVGALLGSKQMELALGVLGEMQIRGMGFNASIISLFIREYCTEGNLESGWKLLLNMQNHGFQPDVVAFTIVIDALCKRGRLKEATSILFKLIQMGISLDSVSISPVIDGYCKVGRLEEAMEVWKIFGFPLNVFVYNSFISMLCKNGKMAEAAELFYEMSKLGIFPDCCIYTTIIRGYCKVGEVYKALKYLGKMLKMGLRPAVTTYTVFIDNYCKFGDLEMAEHLFRKMVTEGLKPDVVAYNTLMDGYGKKGHLHKAFELLDRMRSADVLPDVVTYNILIHSLSMRGFVKESQEILEELITRGFSPDVWTFTNVIGGFSKEGNFEEAFLVWSYMSEQGMRPDVVTCSALLNGYCKARRMEEADVLFRKMLGAGLNPDLILYNTLIHGFCSVGNIVDACQLVNMMAECGIIPNEITYRGLVHGFEKKWVENPVEHAAIKMRQILLKYDIDVDVSQFIAMFH